MIRAWMFGREFSNILRDKPCFDVTAGLRNVGRQNKKWKVSGQSLNMATEREPDLDLEYT